MTKMQAALNRALKSIKKRHLALKLGITPQAVSQWRRVPVERVLDVECLTGVPRHELRPDIYPPSERSRVRSKR